MTNWAENRMLRAHRSIMFAYRCNPNKRLDVATDVVYGC